MRNTIQISFFFLLSFSIFAQLDLDDRIIGTWKVVEVRSTLENFDDLDEVEIEEAKAALKAFQDSKFNFGTNKSFRFDIDFPDLEGQNLKWEINGIQNRIVIEDSIDLKNGVYLEIEFMEKGKDMFFRIIDTPFLLRLQKEVIE